MNGTILVVEDSRTIRLLLNFQLKKAGYAVIEAENGVQGLELAGGQPRPDVIISDVMMPEMDGIEFCRKVHLVPGLEKVPFIFLTTRGEAHQIKEGLDAGGTDFISKPYDARVLLEKVRAYFGASVV